MANNLMEKVGIEKLDVLHDALMDVINDMKSKETNRSERLKDKGLIDCLSLAFDVFDVIKLQTLAPVENNEGEKIAG